MIPILKGDEKYLFEDEGKGKNATRANNYDLEGQNIFY